MDGGSDTRGGTKRRSFCRPEGGFELIAVAGGDAGAQVDGVAMATRRLGRFALRRARRTGERENNQSPFEARSM